MTETFRNLKDAVSEDRMTLQEIKTETLFNVCLYQIADSLNEIDKDLRNIIGELRKRKA